MRAIEKILVALALTAIVLCAVLLYGVAKDQTFPSLDDAEISSTSFEEVISLLGERSKHTNLQKSRLLGNLVGKRVTWTGWVGLVDDGGLVGGGMVAIYSRPITWWYDKRSQRNIVNIPARSSYALLYFGEDQMPLLLKLEIGQKIHVTCLFDHHVRDTTTSLEQCVILREFGPAADPT